MIYIGLTGSTNIVVRCEKVKETLNGTYSITIIDTNFDKIEFDIVDISPTPFVYNEFNINNDTLQLGGGEYNFNINWNNKPIYFGEFKILDELKIDSLNNENNVIYI